MSEHTTPPDRHRGPGPNMIPPPSGPVTSSPGLSGAPSQVPEEAVTLQLASPQPSSAPRRGRTLLFIMLAAVLVAVVGFGSWWFLLRGGSDGESIKPVTGLGQAPQIAWESEHRGGAVGGTAEGLLVIPDVTEGGARLRMLAWADGSERWAVDVSDRVTGAVSVQIHTKLPDGLFGLVVTDAVGKNRFLVHRASNGEFVRELDLGHGSLIGGDTKAVYRYEPDEERIGTVKISRIPDIANSDAIAWSTEVEIVPQEGAYTVKERDGFADFCWINEFGAEISCFKSLSLDDGSPPPWKDDSTTFVRVSGVIVTSEQEKGRLSAYDSTGNQLWQKADSGGPLHVFKDVLLIGSRRGEMIERLDPRSGDVRWRQNWGNGYPIIFDHEGQPVVLFAEAQTLNVGIANMETGEIGLEKHSVASGRVVFRTAGGSIVASDDRGKGVELVAIRAGQAEKLWTQTFDDYTYIEQDDQYLILRSEDKFAVLR